MTVIQKENLHRLMEADVPYAWFRQYDRFYAPPCKLVPCIPKEDYMSSKEHKTLNILHFMLHHRQYTTGDIMREIKYTKDSARMSHTSMQNAITKPADCHAARLFKASGTYRNACG